MKIAIYFLLTSIILSGFSTSFASTAKLPAIRVNAEVHVKDSDGRAVPDATVRLSLPRYRTGDRNQTLATLTNRDGIAMLSGTAQQDYILSAEKPGYYPTQGPHRDVAGDSGLRNFATGIQKVGLELRAIRNPVVGISREIDRRNIPKTGTLVGFDLDVGDWVAPHGVGKSSDFIFILTGVFHSLNNYDQKLILQFGNSGDGILPYRHPKLHGSALKWPYEAPVSGYEPARSWQRASNGGDHVNNADRTGETNYIFRIRSVFDHHGKLIRAMYGVVSNDFFLGGNNVIGTNISFTYALNTDGTRNLEFDPAKTASSPR